MSHCYTEAKQQFASHIPDLLERIDALRARGGPLLLFREPELYSMTALVNRYTKELVRLVVGLSVLVRVFEYPYSKLAGSLLEALSRLLAQKVRIYAYPMSSIDLQQSIQSISASGWQWTDTSASSCAAARPPARLYSC